MVISFAGCARFVRAHPAHTNDERAVGREFHAALEAHGAEAVQHEAPRASANDRSMVFASAESTDSAVAGQGSEALAVFDAAQISRQVLRTTYVREICFVLRDMIHRTQYCEDRDDERAGTAHPSGTRKIAGKGNFGSRQLTPEVTSNATRNSSWKDRPALRWNREFRCEFKVGALTGNGICNANQGVGPGLRHDTQAALCSTKQAASSGIISMLTEHLDAAGDVPAEEFSIIAQGQRSFCRRKQNCLASCLGGPHPRMLQRFINLSGHIDTCTCLSCSTTAAMSARSERSSTPARQRTTFSFIPAWIAPHTATGNSYSPRREIVTLRHASKISLENRQMFILISA